MTLPEEDGFEEIVRQAISVSEELAQADLNEIFRHASPSPGASLTDVVNYERRVGRQLPTAYREFLQVVDGWPAFYQEVDLCSLRDLSGSELMERGWMLVEAADEGSGGILGISRSTHLPIGVSTAGIDVFLLLLEEPTGAVSWVAGGEVERFSSLPQFLKSMVEYNRDTLQDLRADPWLGVSGE
jgi:hypothetical protein